MLQCVSGAKVVVGGSVVGEIGTGLCALIGVASDDTAEDAQWLCAAPFFVGVLWMCLVD